MKFNRRYSWSMIFILLQLSAVWSVRAQFVSTNINDMKSRYHKMVMICETEYPFDQPGAWGPDHKTTDCSAQCIHGRNDVLQQDTELPDDYCLEQNYPNPVNPGTVIQYSLVHASQVVLKVYTILGNEVAALVNEFQTPGRYSTAFDASTLASGAYFCKLDTGQYRAMQQLTVLK